MTINPFLPFPTEINIYILSFLGTKNLCNVSQVNKKANCLALNLLNRPNQAFKEYLLLQPVIDNSLVLNALRLYPNINEVEIEAAPETMKVTSEVLSAFPRLRGFHLRCLKQETFSVFKDEDLLNFIKAKIGLRRLTLQGCSEFYRVNEIPEISPNLDEITIESFHLSDQFIENAAKHLPRLRKLDLAGRNKITDLSLKTLEKCKLEHLEIRFYHFPFRTESVERLVKKIQKLKVFALQGCPKITDKTISLLWKHHTQLQSLYLFGCEFGPKVVEKIAKNMLSLESLDLNDCEKPELFRKEIEKQKQKGRFKQLKEDRITGFRFWDYEYLAYMREVQKFGIPANFQRQISYIYYKEDTKKEK